LTNFPNGAVADGAMLTPATAYKVEIDASNATPLKVTGGASVSGAATAGTLAIGASGDVINGIKTYTTAAVNIAAVNVLATSYQNLDLVATGVLTTDTILAITPTNVVATQFVVGNVITAANNITAAVYSSANSNAATGQTFTVTVKR
jgi:hypothetical protein